MLEVLIAIVENLILTCAMTTWFVCVFTIIGMGFKTCDWIFNKFKGEEKTI